MKRHPTTIPRSSRVMNNRYLILIVFVCTFLVLAHFYFNKGIDDLTNNYYNPVSKVEWDPMKFHTNPNKWMRCIGETFPDHPLADSYAVRPVFLVAWDDLNNFLFIHEKSIKDCPVPCFIAGRLPQGDEKGSCLEEVDGFIFHPPTRDRLHHGSEWPNKREYQRNVLFSTETETNWPILKDENYLSHMDMNMTFSLKSVIPFTYFISIDFYTKFWPWPGAKQALAQKISDTPVMMMISNCAPNLFRTRFLTELMNYVKIDSYGSCLHNKEIPPELTAPDVQWWETKWNLTAKYKMVIAFENSVHEDYVTEKLFHSLIVGTVPIYFGAPNVDRFTPSKKSIIKVSDFGNDAKELANYINRLNENDNEMAEYLKWKDQGPQKQFLDLQTVSPRSGPCRLCMQIAQHQSQLL